ncbi:universal stress protein [Leuconostocaceae bacterium ESL0958]|nr:universal stress protein [Leuconostocaceae bacterium ESL0958]
MNATYQKILVAVDGSKKAAAALDRAIALAATNDSSLVITAVIDTRAVQNLASFDNEVVDRMTEDTRVTLEGYLNRAKEAGVKTVDYRIDYGSPKTVIARDLPKELQTDLIVIGATGQNAVEQVLVGSVTAYVTRTAPVDVLVVRS